MKLNEQQIEFMKEDLSIELVQMLMEDWHYDLAKALSVFYNSETFEHLYDSKTGIYYQSAGYVYDYLKNELSKGKFV